MDVERYALDPIFGMLHDCPNMCGEPERMRLVERGEGPADTFECTGCGVREEKRSWAPFLSLEFQP